MKDWLMALIVIMFFVIANLVLIQIGEWGGTYHQQKINNSRTEVISWNII